jgi:hypothetical protein
MAATERLRQVAVRKLPEVRALVERAELVPRWLEAAADCTCPSLDDCPFFDEPSRLRQCNNLHPVWFIRDHPGAVNAMDDPLLITSVSSHRVLLFAALPAGSGDDLSGRRDGIPIPGVAFTDRHRL